MKKRILSFFLALVMLFSCLSLNVFATEEEAISPAADEPAVGTVVSNTLTAHTDAQIKSYVQSLGSKYFTVLDGTATPSNNQAGALASVDGRYVLSAPTLDSTNSFVQSYNHVANTSTGVTFAGRNWLPGYSDYPAEGLEVFVAQMDFEFNETALSPVVNNPLSLIQLAFYASTSGNSNTSPYNTNQIGAFMPVMVRFSTDGTNGYLEACTSLSVSGSESYEKVMTLEPGVSYTIAIKLDTSYENKETDTYGRYDLYVNGECIQKNISFLNAATNSKLLTFAPDQAYFVDDNYSGLTLKKASGTATEIPAYFFTDDLTSSKFTTDSDNDGIPDIYESVYGITADLAKIIKPVAIGKLEGLKDAPVGVVRWGQSSNVKYSGEAVYYDNLIVYYADEYAGQITDHSFTKTHSSHDCSKATTEVTYTCEICGGQKTVIEAVDANGDRVCDLCIGELDMGGEIPVSELGKYVDSALIRYAEDFNEEGTLSSYFQGHTPYDFGDSLVRNVDENGNGYIKYIKTQNIEDTNLDNGKNIYKSYGQIYTTAGKAYADVKTWPAKYFEEYKGKSYVASADIKIEAGCTLAEYVSFFVIMCYAAPVSGSNALTHAFNFVPVQFTNDGTLLIYDAATNNHISTDIVLTPGQEFNVAVHHTPKTNSFDLYIDGTLRMKDVPAISQADSKEITYENKTVTVDGIDYVITSKGAEDFIPSAVQLFQYYSEYSIETDAFSYDDVKFYYSDEFIECNHDYELTHTHDATNNVNAVSYVCNSCGKTYSANIPMTNIDYSGYNGTGTAPTVEEFKDLAKEAYYANDFSKDLTNAIGVGSVATSTNSSSVLSTKDGILQYLAPSSESTSEAYWQYWFTKNGWSDRFTYIYNNFNELKDDSYTITLDFRIDNKANIASDIMLMQALTYGAFPSGTPNDDHSNFTTVWFDPLKVDTSGNLVCYSNGAKSVTKALTENTWYTITLHHTPSGDENSAPNTYDVFVNGELFAENLIAVPTTNEVILTWNTDTASSAGTQNYVPSTFRICHAKTKGSGSAVSLDNVLIYKNQDVLECKHSFTDTNACDWCGYEVPAQRDDYCDICQGVAISDDVAITGRSATLGELIDMNFYVKLANNNLGEDATATVTCGDRTATVALADAKTENGYKISLPLRSTQMADDVKLTIDGATYTTSIAHYALELIETKPEAADVAKALLNYGAAAQEYFAVKNEDDTLDDVLANAGLSEADKAVTALSDEVLGTYAFAQSGASEDVRFTGAKLQLSSKTHMKLYFKAAEDATVTVNGEAVAKTYDADEGEYYVFLSGITPIMAISGENTVVITSGESTVTANVNAFTAVAAGVANADLTDLMNAYGQYCIAAASYVAK